MTDLPAAGDVLGTPAPVLSPDRVTALVEAVWRLPAGTVRPLTSERDVNVLVDGRYVLKVSNPAEDPAVVDMENTAMAHAARVDPGLPLPSVVRTASGASVVGIADDAGQACLARLVTVIPGSPAEGRPVTTGLAGQIAHHRADRLRGHASHGARLRPGRHPDLRPAQHRRAAAGGPLGAGRRRTDRLPAAPPADPAGGRRPR